MFSFALFFWYFSFALCVACFNLLCVCRCFHLPLILVFSFALILFNLLSVFRFNEFSVLQFLIWPLCWLWAAFYLVLLLDFHINPYKMKVFNCREHQFTESIPSFSFVRLVLFVSLLFLLPFSRLQGRSETSSGADARGPTERDCSPRRHNKRCGGTGIWIHRCVSGRKRLH